MDYLSRPVMSILIFFLCLFDTSLIWLIVSSLSPHSQLSNLSILTLIYLVLMALLILIEFLSSSFSCSWEISLFWHNLLGGWGSCLFVTSVDGRRLSSDKRYGFRMLILKEESLSVYNLNGLGCFFCVFIKVFNRTLAWWLECSPMARETWVQS